MKNKYDISGTGTLVPLISFDCIFDLDLGLTTLIYNEYLDSNVFDKEFFKKPIIEIVKELYLRKESNPLKVFAIDKENPKLDIYYEEFLKEKKKEIIDLSITTNMLSLLLTYKNAEAIYPVILCKDEYEINKLNEEDQFKNIKKVLLSSLINEKKNSFDVIYVKYINDLKSFENIFYTNIYISSARQNFLEDFNYAEVEFIDKLILERNRLTIYDLYNSEVLGKDSLKE